MPSMNESPRLAGGWIQDCGTGDAASPERGKGVQRDRPLVYDSGAIDEEGIYVLCK